MEDNTNTLPVEDNTEYGQKTFTQEEVDSMIQKRVSRERSTWEKRESQFKAREQEFQTREQELNEREFKFNSMEILAERSLPVELADVLNYTKNDDLNSTIDHVERIFKSAVEAEVTKRFRGTTPKRGNVTPSAIADGMRKAMRLS